MKGFQIIICFSWLILTVATAYGQGVLEFRARAENFLLEELRRDPVWATTLGVHDYDDDLPNISNQAFRERYSAKLEYLEELQTYDTTGWSIDDQIDYMLEVADTKLAIYTEKNNPIWKRSPLYYFDRCLYGIFYLTARDYSSLEERLPSIISRIERIPDFLEASKENITEPVPELIVSSKQHLISLKELIRGFSEIMVDSFPEYNSKISSLRDKTVLALEDYWKGYCRNMYSEAEGDFSIGKEAFDLMLSERFFLDFDSDSLSRLAEWAYHNADSLVHVMEEKLSTLEQNYPLGLGCLISSPPQDTILANCYSEIEFVKNFIQTEGIVTVPTDNSICTIQETPRYLNRAEFYDDIYLPPGILAEGKFDSKLIMSFFMFSHRLLEDKEALTQIYAKSFREKVIVNILPGRHFQQQIALKHSSLIRKLQENPIMVEGWILYIKELLLKKNLFDENEELLCEYYKDLRSYALGTIFDVGIHTERISIDSGKQLIRDRLEEDTVSYKGSLYHSVVYPEYNFSRMLGRILIMDMKRKAKAKEGDKFDLREFHDKILSEGRIPPALIAMKYGWD